MNSEARIHLRIVTAAICLAGLVVVYHWAADRFRPPPVVTISQQQATTAKGIQESAEKAGVPMNRPHAEDTAAAIERAATREPDRIEVVKGKNVQARAEEIRKKTGGDMVAITDPKQPDKSPTVKPEETAQLNVYSIRAYPRQFQQVGWSPGEVIASQNWRIGKTKSTVWYVGVYGRADLEQTNRSRVGVLVTRMK